MGKFVLATAEENADFGLWKFDPTGLIWTNDVAVTGDFFFREVNLGVDFGELGVDDTVLYTERLSFSGTDFGYWPSGFALDGLTDVVSYLISGELNSVSLASRDLFLNATDLSLSAGDVNAAFMSGDVEQFATALFAGNDRIEGTAGDDVIDGGAGRDVIVGGRGHDNLSGGDGFSLLIGGAGDDHIIGGIDGIRINGGIGNDTISVGGGAALVYRGDNFGIDKITGWSDGRCHIDLEGGLAFSDFTISQSDPHTTVLSLNSDPTQMIVLLGVSASTIDITDFM